MAFEVAIDRIIDRDSDTLNLTTLFQASEQARRRTITTALAKRQTAPAFLFPQPTSHKSLTLHGISPLAAVRRPRSFPPTLKPIFEGHKHSSRPSKLPSSASVTVGTGNGTASRIHKWFDFNRTGSKTIRIPFFLNRYLTAGALKQFAGMPQNTLLRKRGTDWEVVQDEEQIDLLNTAVTFWLGAMTMLS